MVDSCEIGVRLQVNWCYRHSVNNEFTMRLYETCNRGTQPVPLNPLGERTSSDRPDSVENLAAVDSL